MDTNLDLYQPTQSYLSFASATWINPDTAKFKTPVVTGGIVTNAAQWEGTPVINAYGPPFEITYTSTKKTEMVIGSKAFNIVPVCLTSPFSIVRLKGVNNSVFVRKPLYVKKDQLPNGVSVSSAVAFFFVFREDPQLTPVVIVFKSHLASSIKNAFGAHANKVARSANALVGKPIGVQALPCVLRVGEPRLVGQGQQGTIVDPIFELSPFGSKEDLISALVPPETYKALTSMASNPDVLGYPFTDTSMPRTIAQSLPEAIGLLASSNVDQEYYALPPGNGDGEYDPNEVPF